MRIDSHHHLWHYTPQEYGWIDGSMQSLRRDFLLPDLSEEVVGAGVQATVAVQARQTVEETAWLLELAGQGNFICGVVGWAPIASPDFTAILDHFCQSPLLRGLRHVVQGEPAGFLDAQDFNRGISAMQDTGLVYDILIFSGQIAEATRFVDRHPEQVFVLDHIGKPKIGSDGFASWNTTVRELARRENVVCKLSGMVTEADRTHWSPALLRPYFDAVLDAFGPGRLMAGSDWPVLTVACGYTQWWQILSDWLAPLSSAEREQIEGGVASRVYGLSPASSQAEAAQ